jgi:hypothetical protein
MQARHTEAETFRAAPSGRTDAGGGWLRVQLEQPGVLLLRRLGPGGPREWGRHVRVLTGLGMLICRIAGVTYRYIYAFVCILSIATAIVNCAL